MNKVCLYIFIVLTLLVSGYTSGQSINQLNKFLTYNYTNDDFNSTVQIWGGSQLIDGSFVFGNDRKILHFDGEDWTHIPSIKKDTLSHEDNKVFSLFSAKDTTIYVGRKNVFGKLIYDSIGQVVFQPLIQDSSITNVWSVYEDNDQNIIFTTPSALIYFNPKTKEEKRYSLSDGKDKALMESSVLVDKGILITFSKEVEINAPKEKFVYHFSFQDFSFTELNSKINVRASYKTNKGWFVVDYTGSVYQLDLKTKNLKEKHQLKYDDQTIHVNQILMRNELLWTATERYGVLIFDLDGNLLRSLAGSEGLQDNNVFRMFFDNSSNLWLCLDNGISAVKLNPPMSMWARKDGLEGAIEAFISYEDSLFMMASRSGIFKSKIEKEKIIFSNTHTLNEAAYDIKRFSTDFGERIVVVGYNGIYDITSEDSTANVMALSIYGWELHPSPFETNQLFIGGENFIGLFTYLGDGKWDFKKIKETAGDIIKFIEYENILLYSVKGTGIFSIDKNKKIKQIPISKEVDISGSHFYLEKHQGNIYAGYNRGLLKLNQEKNEFQSIHILGLGAQEFDLNFHRLYSHPFKDELFAVIFNETPNNENKHIGYIQKKDDEYTWHPLAISVLKKGIIYDIKADHNHVFFGMNNGFSAVNRKHLEETKNPWEVYISKVALNDKGVSYNVGRGQALQAIEHGKSIRFDVRANQYFGDNNIRYRFRLKGVSDQWSTFEKNSYKIYDQLPAGKYTIQFQGVNQYDTKSKISNYSFTILPPWYQTWWAYLLYAMGFIIVVYLVTLVSIYRIKQKNKNLEKIVNERTREIAEKNETLEIQKNEISEINSDLLGSINYAKRIQNTILPSKNNLDELFNDYFTFYLPKDIVSGDIYWAQKFDQKIIWSAIDCTGHGVPGAFVSIVGNNTLMRATKEFGLREPAKILDKQRELVIEAFKNEEQQEVKDGMDLALVALDLKTLKLEYAGANNPLVIVRDGEIIEIKADKEPIGEFVKMTPFTNHEIQMQKGDCVYLFSDGYVDQFGGEKNKKFKSKPFKRLLCDIAPLPMKEQHETLQKTLDKWRGDNNQVDDICIFGVRI